MSTPSVGSNRAAPLDGSGMPLFVGVPHVESVETTGTGPSYSESELLAAVADLVAQVSSASSSESAAKTLSDELGRFLSCRRVIVGLCRHGKQTVSTIGDSSRDHIDTKSETVRLADAAMQEAIDRDDAGSWPPRDTQQRHMLLAHRQLSEHLDDAVIATRPIVDGRNVASGAIVIVADDVPTEDQDRILDVAAMPLAACLGLQIKSDGNRFDRLVQRVAQMSFGGRQQLTLALLAVIAFVLCLPIPYRITCKCEVQPVVRRFVAAPFDARLEENFVEPGDLVEVNDVLARLDARDVVWELSGKKAELHRVAKERAGYLASHESGKVELAGLEVERLKLEIEQLEDHFQHLEIRSPIDGIVVQGDLSKSEGVPLEKGATLFEIAPLDQMMVEIWIPENDVRFVDAKMSAKIYLDAFPLQRKESRVDRVHPRAELKEHENVFIAESMIDNSQGFLRPGMQGDVKIVAGRQRIGWVLFHKPVNALLAWFGW